MFIFSDRECARLVSCFGLPGSGRLKRGACEIAGYYMLRFRVNWKVRSGVRDGRTSKLLVAEQEVVLLQAGLLLLVLWLWLLLLLLVLVIFLFQMLVFAYWLFLSKAKWLKFFREARTIRRFIELLRRHAQQNWSHLRVVLPHQMLEVVGNVLLLCSRLRQIIRTWVMEMMMMEVVMVVVGL